ncbi:hypothetical protein L6164_016893 [Bauhinia variegata]|uniref:Uncharacterized protein n=1 Tax=Bauhinia variegata TaxID=167791 RepID=A0ACB9N5X4_BAUVA|nr:hypothetical protein L6164_016893 [Bauhinia variegata]
MEIAKHFKAMAVGANKNREDKGFCTRDEFGHRQRIVRLVSDFHMSRQNIYEEKMTLLMNCFHSVSVNHHQIEKILYRYSHQEVLCKSGCKVLQSLTS